MSNGNLQGGPHDKLATYIRDRYYKDREISDISTAILKSPEMLTKAMRDYHGEHIKNMSFEDFQTEYYNVNGNPFEVKKKETGLSEASTGFEPSGYDWTSGAQADVLPLANYATTIPPDQIGKSQSEFTRNHQILAQGEGIDIDPEADPIQAGDAWRGMEKEVVQGNDVVIETPNEPAYNHNKVGAMQTQEGRVKDQFDSINARNKQINLQWDHANLKLQQQFGANWQEDLNEKYNFVRSLEGKELTEEERTKAQGIIGELENMQENVNFVRLMNAEKALKKSEESIKELMKGGGFEKEETTPPTQVLYPGHVPEEAAKYVFEKVGDIFGRNVAALLNTPRLIDGLVRKKTTADDWGIFDQWGAIIDEFDKERSAALVDLPQRPLFENVANFDGKQWVVDDNGNIQAVRVDGVDVTDQIKEEDYQKFFESGAVAEETFSGLIPFADQFLDVAADFVIGRAFAGGLASRAATVKQAGKLSKTGFAISSFSNIANDSYKSAVSDLGLTPDEAATYAFGTALFQSAIETYVGNIETRFGKSAWNMAQVNAKRAVKAKVGKLSGFELAKEWSRVVGKDILEENSEEVLQGIVDNVAKMITNANTKGDLDTEYSTTDIKESILLTTPLTFIAGGVTSNVRGELIDQAYTLAAKKPDKYKRVINDLVEQGIITEDKALLEKAKVDILSAKLQQIPDDISNQDKTKVMGLSAEKADLENKDNLLSSKAKKARIDQIDETIATIVAGSEVVEALPTEAPEKVSEPLPETPLGENIIKERERVRKGLPKEEIVKPKIQEDAETIQQAEAEEAEAQAQEVVPDEVQEAQVETPEPVFEEPAKEELEIVDKGEFGEYHKVDIANWREEVKKTNDKILKGDILREVVEKVPTEQNLDEVLTQAIDLPESAQAQVVWAIANTPDLGIRFAKKALKMPLGKNIKLDLENLIKNAEKASPERKARAESIISDIESEAEAIISEGDETRAAEAIETLERAEQAILEDQPVDTEFEKAVGISETDFISKYQTLDFKGDYKNKEFGDIVEEIVGKEITEEDERIIAEKILNIAAKEGIKLKKPISVAGVTIEAPPRKASKTKTKGIESVQMAAGRDDLRPAQTGVHFDKGNMIATDSYKLVVVKKKESDHEIYDKIAENAGKFYDRLTKKADIETTREQYVEKEVKAAKARGGLEGKIINIKEGHVVDAKFPQYKAVVPQDNNLTAPIPIQQLMDQAQGAAFALKNADSFGYAMVFEFDGIEIAANPNMLLDVLKVLQANGTKTITIGSSTPTRAMVFTSDNGDFGLVMPVLVGSDFKIKRTAPISYEIKKKPRKKDFKELMEKTRQRIKDAPKGKTLGWGSAFSLTNLARRTSPLMDAIKHQNPDVEEAFVQSGKSTKTVRKSMNSIGERLAGFYKTATKRFPHLNYRKHADIANKLRTLEGLKDYTVATSLNYVRGVITPLAADEYELFRRYVVMKDLINSIDAGTEVTGNLPFRLTTEQEARDYLEQLQGKFDTEPKVQEAFQHREEFMETLHNDLVEAGLISDKDYKTYFHRRTLKYLAEDYGPKSVYGRSPRSKTKKGWQKARTGSKGQDYSTNFLESEFKVVAEGIFEIERKKRLDEILEPYKKAFQQLRKDSLESYKLALENTKNTFGEDSDEYKDLQDGKEIWRNQWERENMPEGVSEPWQSDKGNNLFKAKLATESQIEQMLATAANTGNIIGMQGQHLKAMAESISRDYIVMGGKKTQYLLPDDIRATFEALDRRGKEENEIEKAMRSMTTYWKIVTLFSPRRILKYNINNFFGDLDGLIGADPSIKKYVLKSLQELKKYSGGEMSPIIEEALKHSVINSGMAIKEFADINDTKWVQHLMAKSTSLEKILKSKRTAIDWAKRPVQTYFEWAQRVSNFRENVFRLAAYMRAKEKIAKGDKFSWASQAYQIEQIQDPQEKAAKLAREVFGDYGNLSEFGEWMRKHMAPFYSWQEINMGRYFNLMANAVNSGKIEQGMLARGLTLKAARVGIAMGLMSSFSIAVKLWNGWWDPECNRKLKDAKMDGNYVIMGKNADGTCKALPIQGAFYDFLQKFGLKNIEDIYTELINGDASIAEVGKEMAKAPVQEVLNNLSPFLKTAVELPTGTSMYPDAFNPRRIKDPGEYLARMVQMQDVYKAVTGKPMKNAYFDRKRLQHWVTYDFDPDELAYYKVRNMVTKFAGGGFSIPGKGTQQKSNALYNYKKALRYKDHELADKYLRQYYELGGADQNLLTSIRNSHPLHGLKKVIKQDVVNMLKGEKPKTKFGETLSEADLRRIQMALNYYEKTFFRSQ